MAFRQKKGKKKGEDDFYMPIIAGLILCLPLIPFLFRIFAHPTYFSQWWSPFNWSKLYFYFTDLFSPVLKNITSSPMNFYSQIFRNNSINIGFIIFAIVPALLALIMIIRSNIDSKKINKYLLSVFIATFLTVLIAAIAGKIVFLTKYLTELYPILILMAAIGWAQLNSHSHRVMIATIYIFATLFFIIVSHTSPIRLVRQEGHRLPVLAMQEMGLKDSDKILFLYYPPSRFSKYLDTSKYICYSIDKYNFPEVMDMGTVYDAYKTGYKDYRVFF